MKKVHSMDSSKILERLTVLNPVLTQLLSENGLNLDNGYAITDGNNSYHPYFSYDKKAETVIVTYYGNGFEIFGEIQIENNTITAHFHTSTSKTIQIKHSI